MRWMAGGDSGLGAANATVREHKVLHGGPKQFRNLFRVVDKCRASPIRVLERGRGSQRAEKAKEPVAGEVSAKARGQCQPARWALEHGREEIEAKRERGGRSREAVAERRES
jgi:hypothetical protein